MSTEFEFTVKGMAELKRDLDQIKAALGGVGAAHGAAGAAAQASGTQTRSFGASAASAAIPVAAVSAALTAGFAAAVKFGNELERQTGILNHFKGSIEQAAERTGGLFSKLDLISSWNRTANAGLRLSQKSFADLAVAADSMAEATGTDSVAALEKLTQALASGATRPFKELGIEVDSTKSKMEQQQQVIAAISERFGGLSAGVDTVGGAYEVLGNKMDDAETDFIAGFSAVDTLGGGFAELGGEVRAFTEAIGLASGDEAGGLSVFTQAGITAATMLDGLMVRFSAFVRAIQQASTGDFGSAARELGTTFRSIDTEIRAGGQNMNRARAAQAARDGAASVGVADQFDPSDDSGRGGSARGANTLEQVARKRAQMATEATARREREIANEEKDSAGGRFLFDREADKQRVTAEQDLVQYDAERERIGALRVAQEHEATAALEAQNAEIAEQMELVGELSGAFSGMTMAIAEGGAKGFKVWAKSFAKQQLGLGLEAVALGVGSLFVNPPAATAYFERAALHGAAAAAIGGAGAATGGGRRGGGGGGGGARPEQPSSASGQQGQSVPNNITLHFNSPVAESELGRMNARAAQEAERRFGR